MDRADARPSSSDDPVANTVGQAGERPFFGQPFWWLFFAVVLFWLPALGALLQSDMRWDEVHPAINALLNGSGSVFLIAGFIAIKKGHTLFHKRCMIAAVSASSLFLVSYLVRFYISGTHRYPGDGFDKILYLVILFSHMILAVALVPLVIRTLQLALQDRRAAHRRIARITWPVWIYVSITGVIVYLMLYPLANALYG